MSRSFESLAIELRYIPLVNRGIWIIAFVALGLRLLACGRLPAADASLTALPDQVEYLECGRNLLHGDGLNFVDPRFQQRVHAYRMPGYPILIAVCGGKITIIRGVQCLLDASTTIAVYLLARRWLSLRMALFASAMVAINPFQIYFCGLILSESLFIAMLIWAMTLLTIQTEAAGLLGVLLSCFGALVRPSTTLLPLLTVGAGRRPALLIHVILIEAIMLSTWAGRNHAVVGESIVTTTNSGISAYDGLHAGATGASDQTFIQAMPELKSMSEVERNRYLAERANTFAKSHPLQVARLAVIKLARLWSPIPLSAEYGSNLKLIAIACVFTVPLYLLTVVGIFFGRIPRRIKLFLLAPALYFSLVHAVGVGSLRYRIPADVPMTIIAASGAAALFRKPYGQASADSGKAL